MYPIHVAVQSGNLAALNVLLEVGNVDPNVSTRLGETPLHMACSLSKEDMIIALLNHPEKVMVFCRTINGDTPFHLIFRRLLDEEPEPKLLLSVDTLRRLMQQEIDNSFAFLEAERLQREDHQLPGSLPIILRFYAYVLNYLWLF